MPKQPKTKEKPRFQQPVCKERPESYDHKHLRIRFDLLDFDHKYWGWNKLNSKQHLDFIKNIHSTEMQTWAEIKLAAGGKSHGTNSHSLEIANFDKKARTRLQEQNLYLKVGDTLFSLRLNNTTRIYGARNEEFFHPIWFDPHHGDQNKAAYPISKK